MAEFKEGDVLRVEWSNGISDIIITKLDMTHEWGHGRGYYYFKFVDKEDANGRPLHYGERSADILDAISEKIGEVDMRAIKVLYET